jgi:hypothetical protein
LVPSFRELRVNAGTSGIAARLGSVVDRGVPKPKRVVAQDPPRSARGPPVKSLADGLPGFAERARAPTQAWTALQLRNATPFVQGPQFILRRSAA